MRRMIASLTAVVLATMLPVAFSPAHAAAPRKINYQGYLTNPAGAPLTGTFPMVFSLCDAATAGTCPWSETQSVAIDKGIFNVSLGTVTPLTLTFDIPYYLDIQVNGEQMSARQPLTSVGYAFRAESANTTVTATTATNFSGMLSGDVTGTQGSTAVNTVGGVTAAQLATGANTANSATSTNIPSTLVLRDASGDFSAGIITANRINGTGSVNTGIYWPAVNTMSIWTSAIQRFSIDPAGTVAITSLAPTAGVVHNDTSGNLSGSLVVNADISSAAGITDTKLATISTAGKVANSATTATNTNTANTIVARDASGNFSAGTITANLTGSVTGNLSGNAATVTNGVYSNTANTFTTGGQTINTGAVATKGLIVKGAASQTANLQEWQNSSGSAVASISASGVFTGNGSGLTNLPAGSSTVVFSGGTTEAKNGVNYYAANGQSAANTMIDTQINLVPLACTAKNLYVKVLHFQGGDSGSYVVTLLLGTNGYPAATALKCTVANSGGAGTVNTCSDVSNTVSIAAGNTVSISVDGTGASYSSYGPDMAWGFICQ